MNLNDIRVEIADRPADIRDIVLSDAQARTLFFVRHRNDPTRSSDVARRYDVSIQQASGMLERLYRKGYLCRRQQAQDSGRYEYEYTWELTDD